MFRLSRVLIALWLVLFLPFFLFADDKAKLQGTDTMVAMTDGTELATTVYLPDGKGPFPVIIARTPYNKDGLMGEAAKFCRNGYAFVAQDLRGRFKSKGHHAIIFHNDGWNQPHDGQDTLKWIAAQPWCNGKIGSTGGSALGITQNMSAPGAPEALKAQFVVVALSDMYSQGAYQGGAFRTGLLENWLKVTGMTDVNLKTFVAHPKFDDFWAELNPESQAERVHAPGVFFGGWYDIFLQGTINSFVTLHNHGGEGARGHCRLIIAPIGHGSMTELKYPPNAAKLPTCGNDVAWFDCVLKGKSNGVADEKPVHYYVMGDPTDKTAPGNYWRSADNWPPPATITPFYFHPDNKLVISTKPGGDASKSYKYDPSKPIPTIGGAELGADIGPKDQRKLETRDDVLVFSTDVLSEPIEVTGRISARLFVASDCPDTDFTVKLTDVCPDGRSMLVTDGILRGRFRESFKEEKFLEPGKVYQVTVDLWSTSLIFNKGHRIRVAVSSSNAPRFDPNPNTGHAFRADKETRVATNTIYFSAKYPSCVLLPIYKDPYRADEPRFISPEELDQLPDGIKVVHEPKVALATLTGRSERRLKYTWWYKTTVSALDDDVTIVEFGGFAWHDGKWLPGGTFTGKPYTAKEFAEWYKCPRALLKKKASYSDPTNWSTAAELRATKTRWYFVGVDGKGRRVKGEAVIEEKAEIDPKKPKDPE